MKLYYYHDGHVEHGPYLLHELPLWKLSTLTLIWHDGLKSWTTIENIPEVANLMVHQKVFVPYVLSDNAKQKKKTTPAKKSGLHQKLILPLVLVSLLIIVGLMIYLIYNIQVETVQNRKYRKESQHTK